MSDQLKIQPLYNTFLEWISDYCIDNDLPFDQNAILAARTFGPGLTTENFIDRFTDACNFLHQ